MASIPVSGPVSIPETLLAVSVCSLPDSTGPPPGKRHRYTPSFAKIKVPKRSPLKIFSDEEMQRAGTLDDSFITTFRDKCLVGVPVLQKFEGSFPVDIWREILDHARINPSYKPGSQANFLLLLFTTQVHYLGDLLSLCRTSSSIYYLAIPRLYRTLTIRSPFYYREFNPADGEGNGRDLSPSNLIPIDVLLPPIDTRRSGASRKRVHIEPTIPFPKRELLRYVKDLKIEKWEGWRYPPEMRRPVFDYAPSGHQNQLVVQMNPNSKGVYRLCWRRCETSEILGLHQVLSELLRHHMSGLEKFWYGCRISILASLIVGLLTSFLPDEEIVTTHSAICQQQ